MYIPLAARRARAGSRAAGCRRRGGVGGAGGCGGGVRASLLSSGQAAAAGPSERARGRKLNCRLTTRCAINDDSNVGPARARRAAAAEMRKNESPAARPAAVSCGKGGIVRSAVGERITARRRTVTIRDTSDGCLAAGHANIRLGGRRLSGRTREREGGRASGR